MKIVLPRVVLGNRGDLASRWGVLRALARLGLDDVAVFRRSPADLPPLAYAQLPYGRMRNMLPGRAGRAALRHADTVAWAVGLDMQDDSSLAKLIYLRALFGLYRSRGLKLVCLFQGAGPLATRRGRALAAAVLGQVHTFVARDPGSLELLRRVRPGGDYRLAHDAIFLPGFEDDLAALAAPTQSLLAGLRPQDGRPLVGLNIRQWFHFTAGLLPYQFAQQRYRERSGQQMQRVIAAARELLMRLRAATGARILLVSAYEPGVVPWEDDLPWLRALHAACGPDAEVRLVEMPLTLPAYFGLIARLDLMVAMRLHSALIALRLGVPALNLSYTLKGGAILRHLGLGDLAIELEAALADPAAVADQAATLLAAPDKVRARVAAASLQAQQTNMECLRALLQLPAEAAYA